VYIGLTGNIASGKSTASKFFAELGCYCIDADDISRIVMQPGQKAYDEVVKLFTEGILSEDKTINRKALRSMVFANPSLRKQLEAIVQPAIRDYEKKEVGRIKGEDDKAIIITQAAVAVEAGTSERFDRLIVVYVEPEVQLQRVMKRDDIDEEQAVQIINSQMPIGEKVKHAHFVIDNSGDIDQLKDEVTRVFELVKLIKYGEKNG